MWWPMVLLVLVPSVETTRTSKCRPIVHYWLPSNVETLLTQYEDVILLDNASQEDVNMLSKITENQGAQAWHCNKTVSMSNNTDVYHLKLPDIVLSLQLYKNSNLSIIEGPFFVNHGKQIVIGDDNQIDMVYSNVSSDYANTNYSVYVYYNNRLSSDTLETLRDLCDLENPCLIQNNNECYFRDEIVTDASAINECKTMSTELVLNGTTGETTTRLENVFCVNVTNTNMTDIYFLLNLTSVNCTEPAVIENNMEMCILWREQKFLESFNFTLKDNKKDCDFFCNQTEFEEKDSNCNVIEGNLNLTCPFKMRELKRIEGRLILTNCTDKEINKIVENITLIEAGDDVSITIFNPREHLRGLKINFTRANGAKPLLIETTKGFDFLAAADLKVARNHEVEFTNEGKPPPGVCVFPFKRVVSVKNCTKIEGDVYVDHASTEMDPFKEITGCLIMNRTKLPSYKFLNAIKNMGAKCRWEEMLEKNQTEVFESSCIPYTVRKDVHDELKKHNPNNITNIANFINCGRSDCVFYHDWSKVWNCSRIDGDLVLDSRTSVVEPMTEEVAGCLRMTRTNLPNYDFLLNVTFLDKCVFHLGKKTQIWDNDCIPYHVRKNLPATLKRNVNLKESKNFWKCPCVFFPPVRRIKQKCQWIDGDLLLDEYTFNITRGFKEISGCIRFKETNMKDYWFLADIEEFSMQCAWNNDKTEIRDNTCIPHVVRKNMKSQALYRLIMEYNNRNFHQCPCVFLTPVTGVSKCELIDGDLLLDRGTKIVENGIRNVDGCIRMHNTKLPTYEFLKQIMYFKEKCTWSTNVTEIDTNDCIPYTIRSVTDKKLRAHLDKGKNNIGCGECAGTTADKLPVDCKIVLGDLVIEGVTNSSSSSVEQRLSNVEQLHGRLVVRKNEASSISIPKLQFISSNSRSTPFEIKDNPGLVTIEIPAMQRITVEMNIRINTLIRIEGNPKWKPGKEFNDVQKKLTGADCGTRKNSPCLYSAAAQKSSSKKKEKKEETTEAPKEEEGGNGLAIGIGITVAIVAVLVVAAVAAVVVVMMRRKKKSIKGNNKKDKKDKGKNEAKTPTKAAKTPKKTKGNPSKATPTKSPSREALLPKATATVSKTGTMETKPSDDNLHKTAKTPKSVSKSAESLDKTQRTKEGKTKSAEEV